MSSKKRTEAELVATFGPLLRIPEKALVSLANRVRPFHPRDYANFTEYLPSRLIGRLCGRHDLVHTMEL